MNQQHIFESADVLKEKFKNLFLQHKKVRALENYGECVDYDRIKECKLFNKQLALIKICMKQGFLDEIEAQFIDHMVKKVNIEYLYWSHRTKNLKGTMAKITRARLKSQKQKEEIQMLIDFDKAPKSVEIPSYLVDDKDNRMEKRK